MAQSKSTTVSYHSIKTSPSYHLFTTVVIIAWSIFILATIIVHELARHYTERHADYITLSDVDWAIDKLPWSYNPESGLPNLLRTAFTQAHGPITSMHLARLVVGTLDVSGASPRTWMEVFWLADRRWAGPFGLGKTGRTIISRRLRVSLGFILLALLNVVALITPVVMSRAYHAKTASKLFFRNRSVFEWDVADAGVGNLAELQLENGLHLWGQGLSAPDLLPRNTYYKKGYVESDQRKWFFTGDVGQNKMELKGIAVSGRCEMLYTTSHELGTFHDRCLEELRASSTADQNITLFTQDIAPKNNQSSDYFSIISASFCSNIRPKTTFGSTAWSWVLFRMTVESEDEVGPVEKIMRCNGVVTAAIADVDGSEGSFSYITTLSEFDEAHSSTTGLLNPIAAITQSDLQPFQQSVSYKSHRFKHHAEPVPRVLLDDLMVTAMWDGVLLMSSELWNRTRREVKREGQYMSVESYVSRSSAPAYALFVLLGIWFMGMFAATVVFLRPAWTSALDGYAVARMLQYQPVVAGTSEVWFTELEKNEDMLEQFKMHDWQPEDVRSRQSLTRTRSNSV